MDAIASDGKLDALAQDVFGAYGCTRFGVALGNGGSFDALARSAIGFKESEAALRVHHDGAGAPYLADERTGESPLAISLTDEDETRGIAWAEPMEQSELVGVGIDLAARGDFPPKDNMMGAYRRIFTARELQVIESLAPGDFDLGATLLFSGKEAAFKSASQRIRQAFEECGGDVSSFACPYFETRDIEVLPCDGFAGQVPFSWDGAESAREAQLVPGAWQAGGIAHIGDAGAAFAFLGIGGIRLRFALVADKVICVAAAIST